jgi:hypothetical protein
MMEHSQRSGNGRSPEVSQASATGNYWARAAVAGCARLLSTLPTRCEDYAIVKYIRAVPGKPIR